MSQTPATKDRATADAQWHLDKKVPIALIVGLLIQLGVGIWFAGMTKQRDDEQERRISVIETQNMAVRMSVLETQVGDIKSRVGDVQVGVQETNQKLDRIIEKGRHP